MATKRFVRNAKEIGFEDGDNWVRFDFGERSLMVDKFGEVKLSLRQADDLAGWLLGNYTPEILLRLKKNKERRKSK